VSLNPSADPPTETKIVGRVLELGDCAQASQGRSGQLGIRNTIAFGTKAALSILLLSDRRLRER
jgi:hypothetical protein